MGSVSGIVYAAVGAFIIALLTALGVQTHRLDKANLALAERDKTILAAANAATEAARDHEQKLGEVRAIAATQFEEGKKYAQVEHDRIVAGLDDGTVRLRRQWSACETKRLSEGAAAEREFSDAERRRHESAARIVRAADECDAQVKALIEDSNQVRAVINGTYEWRPGNLPP